VNEIEVVADIRPSPDTAELIVVKRKLVADSAVRLAGEPLESRVSVATRQDDGPTPDRERITISRRARIPLDTLPELERAQVLEAVQSLAGTDPAHWPADRVQALATNGSPTYLLRVSPALRAFVAPAGEDRVELLDVVRTETLELFRDTEEDPGEPPRSGERGYPPRSRVRQNAGASPVAAFARTRVVNFFLPTCLGLCQPGDIGGYWWVGHWCRLNVASQSRKALRGNRIDGEASLG
jgi:hypothetical protein